MTISSIKQNLNPYLEPALLTGVLWIAGSQRFVNYFPGVSNAHLLTS